MEEVKDHSSNRFLNYLVLIISFLLWAGAWSFPVIASDWINLAGCSEGFCGIVTQAYSTVLFRALVIGVLLLLVAKEFLIPEPITKLKLNLGVMLLGALVAAVFIAGLSLPLLRAEPV